MKIGIRACTTRERCDGTKNYIVCFGGYLASKTKNTKNAPTPLHIRKLEKMLFFRDSFSAPPPILTKCYQTYEQDLSEKKCVQLTYQIKY